MLHGATRGRPRYPEIMGDLRADSRPDHRCRVVYLLDRLGSGGIAQMMLNTMGAIDRAVIDPVVVLTRCSPSMDHLDQLRRLDVEVVELGRKSRYDLAAWRRLFPVLRNADLMHSHGVMSNQWARLWGRILRVPVVTHDHTAAAVKPGIIRFVDRFMWRLSERVVAVSDYDRRMSIELESIPNPRIVRVYNGVNATALRSSSSPTDARRHLDIRDDLFVVAMVGRLVDQKNHKGAFDAIGMLPERIKARACILIVGDGPLRSVLESDVESQLSDVDVRFLGQRPDVPLILASADLLLMPSHWECLPMTVLEAVASGCPVVASPVGGIPEILDGIGWPRASSTDPMITAQAIEAVYELSSSEREARVDAGFRKVQSTFDSSVTARQLEELYLDVTAESVPA